MSQLGVRCWLASGVMVAASMWSAGVGADVGDKLLAGPLATLEPTVLYQPRTALELDGITQLEAERLMAVADAAAYGEVGGKLLLLVNPAWSDPERLAEWFGASSGITPDVLAAAPRTMMTLVDFATELDRALPGLVEGTFGQHLLKIPVRMEAPDDLQLSPTPAPESPSTDVLVEGFESGFFPTWTSTRWLRSPAASASYAWNGINCDHASGSVAIDSWRGGTSGAAYQNNCTQAYPDNLGPLWTYDNVGVDISSASQAWLEISVAIWTENFQGDSLSILFRDPRDGSWTGFWHAGAWHDPWWRFTYDLRNWIGSGDLTRFDSNNLAFVFMSDSSVNPGFGARIDDIRITRDTTPPLSCAATAAPSWGAAPLPVNFTGSYVGSLPGPNYFWSFDDGTASTSQNPSHTYASSGDLDVWFEVDSITSHAKCLSTVHVTAHRGGNDNCSGATPMTPSFTQAFNTTGSTRDQPGSVPATACTTSDGYEPGATAWYSFTPTRAGSGKAWACPTSPSSYQPWFTTFQGSCGSMTWLHCWRYDAVTDCGGTTPTPVLDMVAGTTYHWQVGGQADQAGAGTMRFEFCPYPLSFAHTSPADGATVGSTPVALQWQAVADANLYDVYYGSSNPPPLYQIVATTSLAVPVTNGTKYWNVVAKNSCGTTTSSSGVWSFTGCIPPAAPALSAPANGSTVAAGPVSLQWGAAAGATSYTVSFGTSSPPPVFATGVAGTSFGVTAEAGSTYFWQVTAVNSCTSTSSAIWSLTTATSTVIFADGFETGTTSH